MGESVKLLKWGLFITNCFSLLALGTLAIVAKEHSNLILIFSISTVFLFFLNIFLNLKAIKKSYNSKILKYSFQEFINLSLIFAILGLANYLVYKNDYFLDTTKNKINSLSEQSVKVLENLKFESFKMTLFAEKSSWKRYEKLIDLYGKVRQDIVISFVDTHTSPSLIELYNITENGTLIIETDGKVFKAVATDELTITNLIKKTQDNKKYTIGYTFDHGELDFNSNELSGVSYLKSVIKDQNYKLQKVSLLKSVSNIDTLLILNPTVPLLEIEKKNLDNYLKGGGSLITTLSPRFSGEELPQIDNVLRSKGIEFQNVLVLDRLAVTQGAQASIPVITKFDENHQITKDFKGRVLHPVSGAFKVSKNAKILYQTLPIPASWGESNFEEVKKGKSLYKKESDIPGPLVLAAAYEGESSRIVAFSSSSFISNQFKGQTPNFNLFLNSLSWAFNEQNLTSVSRPKLDGDLIYLSSMQVSLIFYICILFVPTLFFFIAIFMYRKRINS